ncbi:hypothetical protein [Chelatococcus reniformis]|nr:hypothetical protein [Chelatococcus reniformis]
MERRTAPRAVIALIAAYALVLQALMLSALPLPALAGHAGALCTTVPAPTGQADPERPSGAHELCCVAACAGPSLATPPQGDGASSAITAPPALLVIFPTHRPLGMAPLLEAATSARGPPAAA